MTQPCKKDFVLYQGAALEEPFQYTEDDETTPIDISDYAFKMQVRTAAGAEGDPVLELVNDDGVDMSMAEEGWFILTVSAVDSADLPPGKYVYDLDVIPGMGQQAKSFKGLVGQFIIKPEVTV